MTDHIIERIQYTTRVFVGFAPTNKTKNFYKYRKLTLLENNKIIEEEISYYPNLQIKTCYTISNNSKTGKFIFYHKNGVLNTYGFCIKGFSEGKRSLENYQHFIIK
jgi:antitoxin component YwqK of YwqJK toxin-antitoxin module